MIISSTELSTFTFDTALLRDLDILCLCQQSITKAFIALAPAEKIDLSSVLNHIKIIANTIIRTKIPAAQSPERNDDIAELSHAQNRLVDVLLYRSRLQALLWTIRQTCKAFYRNHVAQHT